MLDNSVIRSHNRLASGESKPKPLTLQTLKFCSRFASMGRTGCCNL